MARLRNESLVLGFGLGGLAFSAIANSAEMRFVSKFDVAKEAVEPPGTAALHPHEILGIRFAPDGERIAVVFGIHSRVGAAPVTHVSVFAQRSSEVLYVTNISAQSGGYVSWSPAGTHLLIQSKPDSFVVDLTKNSQCDAEGSGETGFVSTSTFITNGYGGSTRLRFYDLNCQTIQQIWTKQSVSIDVEPEKSLLAVVSDGEVEVLRGPDWKPNQLISTSSTDLRVKFFNFGKGLCGSPWAGPGPRDLVCWDAESGAVLNRWPKSNGAAYLTSAATRGPVVSFVESHWSQNVIMDKRKVTNDRWVVWNPVNNTTLGSLNFRMQKPLIRKMPWVTALSPDGKFFAIGGEGTVELYAIDPTAVGAPSTSR